jgi:hypothetical protein
MKTLIAFLALIIPACALDVTVASYNRPIALAIANGHAQPLRDGTMRIFASQKVTANGNHFEIQYYNQAQVVIACITCGQDALFGFSVNTMDFDMAYPSYGLNNAGGNNTIIAEASVPSLTSSCSNTGSGAGTGWGVVMFTINLSTYAITNVTWLYQPTSCQGGVLHPRWNQTDTIVFYSQKYCDPTQGTSACTTAETNYCNSNAGVCSFGLWQGCFAPITYTGAAPKVPTVGTQTCYKAKDLAANPDMGLAQIGQLEPGGSGGTFSATFSTNSTTGWYFFQSSSACAGQKWDDTDVIAFNPTLGNSTPLTLTGCNNLAWNEHGAVTPDGTQIIFAATGNPTLSIGPYVSNADWNGNLETSFSGLDLFLYSLIYDNGIIKLGQGRRLTYFGVAGNPEYDNVCNSTQTYSCGIGGGATDFFATARPYTWITEQIEATGHSGWTTFNAASFATVFGGYAAWSGHQHAQ